MRETGVSVGYLSGAQWFYGKGGLHSLHAGSAQHSSRPSSHTRTSDTHITLAALHTHRRHTCYLGRITHSLTTHMLHWLHYTPTNDTHATLTTLNTHQRHTHHTGHFTPPCWLCSPPKHLITLGSLGCHIDVPFLSVLALISSHLDVCFYLLCVNNFIKQ